jgi:hypothetical protein
VRSSPGDTLQDRGNGLQFLGDLPNNFPAERAVAAEQILAGMQPLLALPVEIVLLTHGAPADGAALERALAASPSKDAARCLTNAPSDARRRREQRPAG